MIWCFYFMHYTNNYMKYVRFSIPYFITVLDLITMKMRIIKGMLFVRDRVLSEEEIMQLYKIMQ